MRIFLSLYPSGNASVLGSKTWLHNLYEPLLDLGHEVYLVRIDEAETYLKAKRNTVLFKEKFSEYVLQTFKKEYKKKNFNLFFSYFTDKYIYPEIIDEIKKIGVPTANFSCNNTHQFYLTNNIAPHFDYNLHSEKDAGEKFKKIGANPVWFQMAANPKYYYPIKCEKEYDVSFVGGNYAKRSYYIWHLLENNVDVHCFGPNWLVNKPMPFIRNCVKEFRRNLDVIKTLFVLSSEKRSKYSSKISLYDFNKWLRNKYQKNLHYPISDDEMIKLYSQSKISLGFLEVFDNHDPSSITKQHLHLREFEAPMCGALYFTNYCEELTEFYETDKEVIVFRSEHELLEKVKYYLYHPREAEKIRWAGHKKALKCHTYQKRFEDLFTKIGLK